MNKWKTDVAVLCIFFARPKQFAQCFEAVRKARPKTLLLWQDGPRENRPDDIENIERCRKIAENIDWECEVYKNYHDKNMGCDPSTFYSHKWAFSIVDKCIILEDDLVPSDSFFLFCKEMLDKYENDERIDRICGRNNLGIYDIPYDYFFNIYGNSWGWASWKRVADKWEENYDFIEDEYAMNLLKNLVSKKELTNHIAWKKTCKLHRKEKIPYWEYIIGAESFLNNRLSIYPSKNMIKNVGLDINSTHAPSDIKKVSKEGQYYFNLEAYDLNFPLNHPKYVLNDLIFTQYLSKKTQRNFLTLILSFIKKSFLL